MNALYEKMLRTLKSAQTHRGERLEYVNSNNPDEKYTELGWIVFERQTMLDAVNEERKAKNLTPVEIKHIVNVETQAVGHADYTRKFALYCSELVTNPDYFPRG